VAEQYYKVFDTYQILPNMPAGFYRLSWQGFYRNGNIANGYLRHTFGTEDTAEIYANEQVANMLSIYDASVPYTYDPYTYPDNVSTANQAFLDGYYQQQMEFTLEETTDLRIGMRHFTPTVFDWACVDNFSLIYMKEDITQVKGLEADKQQPSAVYDISGRRVASPTKKGVYIVNGKKVLIK
jgi:hypothetical protein